MRCVVLGLVILAALTTSSEAPAHGPERHVVTIGRGPRFSATTLPSSFLDPDRMHSIYLCNMTTFEIDRVAVVPSSLRGAPQQWTILDPPIGNTCAYPKSQRCFDQALYKRLTISSCGESYRVLISWAYPDGSRGQAVADSIVADCTQLHGLVVTLQ